MASHIYAETVETVLWRENSVNKGAQKNKERWWCLINVAMRGQGTLEFIYVNKSISIGMYMSLTHRR